MTIEQKKLLRREMRIKRSLLTEESKSNASHKIISRLINNPIYKSSSTIMAYVSMPEEIQLKELFDDAFANYKLIAIPLIISKGTMKPVFLPTVEDLVIGDFGIMTVRQDKRKFVDFNDIDCIIVPGAAFDRKGNRLGLGGGYYDRFLNQVDKAKRIALAFDFQIIDEVPIESHDRKMDLIITESETINIERKD